MDGRDGERIHHGIEVLPTTGDSWHVMLCCAVLLLIAYLAPLHLCLDPFWTRHICWSCSCSLPVPGTHLPSS